MIPDIKTVQFEIEKLNPQSDDIICVKFPEDCFEGISLDHINQLGSNLQKIFKERSVIISKSSDLTTFSKSELAEIGLQRINE